MIERPHKPARLCVLISGGGRTLLNLLDRIEAGELDAHVALVIANRACSGAVRAQNRGLSVQIVGDHLDAVSLRAMLVSHKIDWVVLAGFLRLVPVVEGYGGKMVNIHPALLPAFGGPGMYGQRVHEAVIASGARESGCTVHFCDAQYDKGPIILQKRCEVRPDDTPETLAARVFELEKQALPEALQMLITGRARLEGGRVVIDTERAGA